jgi:hypothetical protein
MNFTVCEHKESCRIALLSENDDSKDWDASDQVIEASNWQSARKKVDMSNIWQSPYGEYYWINYVE